MRRLKSTYKMAIILAAMSFGPISFKGLLLLSVGFAVNFGGFSFFYPVL